MTAQTWDAAAKERVKEALLAQERAGAEATLASAADQIAGSALDTFSAGDDGDRATAGESGDMAALLQESAQRSHEDIAQIEALDVSPTDVVRPGAFVGFDGDQYVVGVVADALEIDGQTFEGISPASPVGAAIDGLKAGDTFTVNGTKHKIDFVA